jgi:uncharacterized membrane protein
MSPIEFRTGVIRPIECYKEGWELIKDQYWLLLGITIVGMIIGGASMYILLGAMICGIYYCYFQKIDGKPVTFEALFKGFNYFLPGFVLMLLILAPLVIVIAGIYVPLIMTITMGSKLSDDELMAMLIGIGIIEFIFTVLMVCLHTLLMFSFPLIVDRNLSVWQSIVVSAKAVMKNLSGVVGLFLVGFAVSIAGYLLLCIGIYLAIPLIFAANVVAYRKIFPTAQPGNFNMPPQPTSFYDAGRAA